MLQVIVDAAALRSTALGLGVLTLRYVGVTFGSLLSNLERGGHPAEDRNISSAISKKEQTLSNETTESWTRWSNALRNDFETLPLGLALMALSLLVGYDPKIHATAVTAFVAGRTLYTPCYIWGLQPFRSLAWFTAVGGMLTFAYNICYPHL
mmetsp:Transcript_12568/g.24353  ORF Transcript_12568/g.24353 Transcript_12568/m.24353 type:complete len:152 (+) Transcript_12568:588-1043(+)|eukprot:CAMPEP_0171501196 /NCGR_PEP_ID=MMETSP0958-20121227/9422_1 /TAXON_ID=87120 /ORGANISM="Aurantiochytrium limacinum, Strain ATCCMYA-1381" /LENGTH=151 /DNA_ID=CAMNT_0012035981 /DNA_START=562 /DNA_END=1017 /DNA_ORIENTATION=-